MPKKTITNLEMIAEKFIKGFSKLQSIYSLDTNFPFGFPLFLREIADSGNRELFQRLINSYVLYSERVNQGDMDKEQIKLEALDFIEFQCMIADTRRMTIGIPAQYKTDGTTRKMFLDIYSGQLANDKRYLVTSSIKL